MPAKQGPLQERPSTVVSGEPLTYHLVVQRRSDVLLEEQMENVQNVQAALSRVLLEVEVAKTSEEQEFHTRQAEDLQQRCQQMILISKIVKKVNTELSYARAELQKALADGTSRDIATARKRVGWLETRIEKLLGKERQRSPTRAHMKSQVLENPCYRVDGDSPCSYDDRESDMGSMADFMSQVSADYHRASTGNLTGTPIEPAAENFPDDISTNTGPTTEKGKPSKNLSFEDTNQKDAQPLKLQLDDQKTPSSCGASSVNFTVSSVSSCFSSSSENSEDSAHTHHKSPTPHLSTADFEKVTPIMNSLSTTNEQTFMTEFKSALESDDLSNGEIEIEHGGDGPSKDGSDLEEHDWIEGNLQGGNHMEDDIAGAGKTTQKRAASGVRIQSQAVVESLQNDKPLSSAGILDVDKADAYWNSEHHRFEYNEHAPVLLDLNPLSYHRMGLAIPGSFVEDVDGSTALPWRTRKGSSAATQISDVHRNALDKLSLKVHKMYTKVKEASMLSVEKTREKEYGKSTLMQNFEDISQKDSTSAKLSKNSKEESEEVSETKQSIALPPLTPKRQITFYPKPLLQPKRLPATKTNVTIECPPSTEKFCTSLAGKDSPVQCFVDQRNLHNETRFTSSLFKTKAAKRSRNDMPDKNALNNGTQLPDNGTKLSSLKSSFKAATSLVRLGKAVSNWSDMKPKSGYLDHSGLKWERIKGIVHKNLNSHNVQERIDAACHLAALKCSDPMVQFGLRGRLQEDPDNRVVYESMKALMSLGFWDEEILSHLVVFLEQGNSCVQDDLLMTIMNAKNVQYVDKRLPSFGKLSNLISDLSMKDEPNDMVSFHSAICLGKLCVIDENAIDKLRQVMEMTSSTHDKAQAMEILVQQMNEHKHSTIKAVLAQLRSSPVWKYRKDAAHHLSTIGAHHMTKNGQLEEVYELLDLRLWDDPNKSVRLGVAKAIASLGLFARACEKAEKRLSDPDEIIRAQAVISIGTLGLKAPRISRVLMEMMELDSSDYVRLMILRTFGMLGAGDKFVVQMLRDKEKGEGPMAREAKRALNDLAQENNREFKGRTTNK